MALRDAVAWSPASPSPMAPEGPYAGGLHLAVMTGPFLKLIVEGEKTVESRFHRQRRDPLFAVEDGDLIVFKQSGQAATHVAEVKRAHFVDLTEVGVSEVRHRWQHGIAATDDTFWEARQDARWVSLFELSEAWELPCPVTLRKRDRRAWIRYPTPE